MASHANGTEIKLSGLWNLSGVVLQIESLSTLHQLESDLEKLFRIDCSEIKIVDMSGLQLLHVWLHCLSLRGVRPELINLPEGMQQSIKQMGLEKSFSEFITGVS
jgi:anti-anti-sigma regulatory factor